MKRVRDAGCKKEMVLLRARRAEHRCSAALRDLHGGETDSARRRMDQHGLASRETRQIVQRVFGGEKRDRNRCRFLERQPCRFRSDQQRMHAHEAAEASGCDCDDSLPWRHRGHSRRDTTNDAGAFVAERARFRRVQWIEVEALEHVAEIQPRSSHLDFDFALAKRRGQ